ncbi:hypothetical protein KQX54_003454 [Cotesia glomerata]|uniref:Uncharacterized protein n=1 Tax=Cotesia glomerata TaxID=32391 RepID=A0AAV7IPU6_COTGL|nr:hypothetical protein KQX54_003454 [Cotesia glomerata]
MTNHFGSRFGVTKIHGSNNNIIINSEIHQPISKLLIKRPTEIFTTVELPLLQWNPENLEPEKHGGEVPSSKYQFPPHPKLNSRRLYREIKMGVLSMTIGIKVEKARVEINTYGSSTTPYHPVPIGTPFPSSAVEAESGPQTRERLTGTRRP